MEIEILMTLLEDQIVRNSEGRKSDFSIFSHSPPFIENKKVECDRDGQEGTVSQ
jgi:hypothetical protein